MPLLELRHKRHPYTKLSKFHWFWCLLLGPIYFAINKVWRHAAISALLAIATLGISWLIYPFFARQLVRGYFLRRGWEDVSYS